MKQWGFLILALFSYSAAPAWGVQFSKIMNDHPGNFWGTLYFHQGVLYVSDTRQNLVFAVERDTVTSIPVRPVPQGMVAHGDFLFVATTRDNFLTVIDTRLKRVVKEINIKNVDGMIGPSGLALENQTLYVSDSGAQLILPIDLSFPGLTPGVPYPTGPKLPDGSNDPYNAYTVNLLAASAGKVFTIALRSMFSSELNIIRVLEGKSGTTLLEYKPWEQGEGGRYNAIYTHSDGTVFVSAPAIGSVLAVDPATLRVARIQTTAHWPIALTSVGKYLVVLDRGPNPQESFDPVANEKYKPALEVIDPSRLASGQAWMGRFDLSEISNGQIIRPSELASSPEGVIYVKSESLVSKVTGVIDKITGVIDRRSCFLIESAQ